MRSLQIHKLCSAQYKFEAQRKILLSLMSTDFEEFK